MANKFKPEAHHLFFLSLPLLFLLGILKKGEVLNHNIYDTYIVIANSHFLIYLGMVFLLYGMSYWILEKLGIAVHRTLASLHTLLTLGGGLLLYCLLGMYREELVEYTFNIKLSIAVTLLFLVTLLGQLLFPVNLLLSWLQNKSTQ